MSRLGLCAPRRMQLANRHYLSGDGYRFGFNGKEADDEWNGEGNMYNYGFRIHDPRLGRFLSVDPLAPDYPWYTPYQYAGNKVINSIDVDGLEDAEITGALNDASNILSDCLGFTTIQGVCDVGESIIETGINYGSWAYDCKYPLIVDDITDGLDQVVEDFEALGKNVTDDPIGETKAFISFASDGRNRGRALALTYLLVGGGKVSPTPSPAARPKLQLLADDGVPIVASEGISIVAKSLKRAGRAGKQARLREIMQDSKWNSADRGWLRNELRRIKQGNGSKSMRVPRNGRKSPGRKAAYKGYELAHPHDSPASAGNDYSRAKLKNHADHKIETKIHSNAGKYGNAP